MNKQVTAPAAQTRDAQATGEVFSRRQASGQSKPSFRLFFFTSLSVIGCALALANVATAATPAGEDQYVEQAPNGGGTGPSAGNLTNNLAGADGILSESDVKKAAEKNKKKAGKPESGDDGSTGASGAVAGAGTTPKPPAASSVAASAKIGPVSRNTALIIGALVLLAGLGTVAFGGGAGALFGGAGASANAPLKGPNQ
jgi:hypothetical protein